ncbi:MAG TPA: glycosyltransferase [Solirubrobacteraceae bacterium]|nr:glycosyltransferase [Solirubrobacteraceae bacterium]
MSAGARQRATAIVVAFGNRTETLALVDRLVAAVPVIVCDNDGDFPQREGTTVIRPSANIGFGAGVNAAAREAAGEYLLIANPDTDLGASAAGALIARMQSEPALGVLGPRLVYPDGRPQINGGRFSGVLAEASRTLRLGAHLRRTRGRLRRDVAPSALRLVNRDWISGAVMVLRADAFRAVGGFDTGYWMYFEDEDLCRRLRARGFGVAVDAGVTVTHRVGGSGSTADPYRSRAYQASRARYHDLHSSRLLARLVARSARHIARER